MRSLVQRSGVLVWCLALPFLSSPPLASAQGDDPDLKAYSSYRLTVPKYKKYLDPMVNLSKAAEKSPAGGPIVRRRWGEVHPAGGDELQQGSPGPQRHFSGWSHHPRFRADSGCLPARRVGLRADEAGGAFTRFDRQGDAGEPSEPGFRSRGERGRPAGVTPAPQPR